MPNFTTLIQQCPNCRTWRVVDDDGECQCGVRYYSKGDLLGSDHNTEADAKFIDIDAIIKHLETMGTLDQFSE